MSNHALAMGSGSLGVDDTLRDALAGEVSELVKKVEVLHEDGAVCAHSEGVLVIVEGVTLRVSNSFALHNNYGRVSINPI